MRNCAPGWKRRCRQGFRPKVRRDAASAGMHRRWLATTTPGLTPAMHRGIAELYVADQRFTAYYDRAVPGCARFLRDAVTHWAG